MQNVAIIKYNAGNTQSVLFALERLGHFGIVSDQPDIIQLADKVIIPGVGEAGSAMNYLKEKGLDEVIRNLKQPVLGICLGMQLLCEHSEENDADCLGVFKVRVKRLPGIFKVPHVGWNKVNGAEVQDHYYFLHSYYAELNEDTVAVTECGVKFSAALKRDNFYGVQFHPEKSGRAGNLFLKMFLES